MNHNRAWRRYVQFLVIFFLCCLFFVLRFPSLFEPYWYGDEGIYHVIGRGLNAGRQMYVGVWDNKPPLLYTVYALFNADQFQIRLVSIFFGLSSVVVFFLLSRNLFHSFRIAVFTTFIFSLFFSLPTIEGNIANAENFMILPALLAGYLINIFINQQKNKNTPLLFFSGLLMGLSFLTKVVGLFDFIAFIVFLFITEYKDGGKKIQVRKLINTYLPLFVGFGVPVLLTVLYFFSQHTFTYFIESALKGNVGYVGWKNDFFIPQGLLIFKSILLAGFTAFLFIKRKYFTDTELFIYLWLAYTLFSAFFSQRPYTHYMLVLLPSFSLATGLLFYKQHWKKTTVVAFLLSVLFYGLYSHFDHWDIKRTVAYYSNFISFMSGKRDVTTYRAFFDPITPRDYEVAAYIKKHTNPGDIIFLWGNSAQIYVLSETLPPGRFSVAYHVITNRSTIAETIQAIEKTKPEYIIIMPGQEQIPFELTDYAYKVTIEDTFIYERIN